MGNVPQFDAMNKHGISETIVFSSRLEHNQVSAQRGKTCSPCCRWGPPQCLQFGVAQTCLLSTCRNHSCSLCPVRSWPAFSLLLFESLILYPETGPVSLAICHSFPPVVYSYIIKICCPSTDTRPVQYRGLLNSEISTCSRKEEICTRQKGLLGWKGLAVWECMIALVTSSEGKLHSLRFTSERLMNHNFLRQNLFKEIPVSDCQSVLPSCAELEYSRKFLPWISAASVGCRTSRGCVTPSCSTHKPLLQLTWRKDCSAHRWTGLLISSA